MAVTGIPRAQAVGTGNFSCGAVRMRGAFCCDNVSYMPNVPAKPHVCRLFTQKAVTSVELRLAQQYFVRRLPQYFGGLLETL